MEYNRSNSSNLYDLYVKAGKCSGNVSLKQTDFYELVCNKGSIWPNCIFNVTSDADEKKLIFSLNEDLSLFNQKPIIISEENSALEINLRKNGYMPVDFWEGMFIVPVNSAKENFKFSFTIGNVNNDRELSEWLSLVSKELFTGNELDINIFKDLGIQDCKFFYIKSEGEMIATTMIFRDENNVDGIYMVCVRKSHRGKGFGKIIMKHTLQFLFENNSRLCVLQSTRLGKNLYCSLGFGISNRYNLFMKIK